MSRCTQKKLEITFNDPNIASKKWPYFLKIYCKLTAFARAKFGGYGTDIEQLLLTTDKLKIVLEKVIIAQAEDCSNYMCPF